MEPNSPNSPDRLEQVESLREKESRPQSKRMFWVVVGFLGVAMSLVASKVYSDRAISFTPSAPSGLEMAQNLAPQIEAQQETFLERIPTPTPIPPTPRPTEPPARAVYRPAPQRQQPDPLAEQILRQRMTAMGARSALEGWKTDSGPGTGSGAMTPEQIAALLGKGEAPMPGGAPGRDPNGQEEKLAFLDAERRNPKGDVYLPYTREDPATNLSIQAGTVVPCVLISSINSDLPGEALGQVSENVYDSATGRYLLIPQGAKVLGKYDSRIKYGQKRLLVVWNRILYPDGSSIYLQGMQGTDALGVAGFKDGVDRHYGELLAAGILTSLFVGAYDVLRNDDSSSSPASGEVVIVVNDKKSDSDIMREALGKRIADLGVAIFERELDRQPTLTVRPGFRFNVFVAKDIAFERAWQEN